MTRRRFVIFAHWVTAFLLAVLLIEGPSAAPWLTYAFAGLTGLWFVSYVVGRGPLGTPGPRLVGALRTIHRLQHHALYVVMAIAALASVTVLEASSTGRALTVLLFLGLLHGTFHLWRHTALFDGALRMILPRFMHGIL
ncbi:MAG: hypothetical protein HKP37_00770 [Boseongicola sp.]|nr:hypothetical protein [Boseongicola sp.]NNL17249.1 hypothetical protein [Boseongicola sp.]